MYTYIHTHANHILIFTYKRCVLLIVLVGRFVCTLARIKNSIELSVALCGGLNYYTHTDSLPYEM